MHRHNQRSICFICVGETQRKFRLVEERKKNHGGKKVLHQETLSRFTFPLTLFWSIYRQIVCKRRVMNGALEYRTHFHATKAWRWHQSFPRNRKTDLISITMCHNFTWSIDNKFDDLGYNNFCDFSIISLMNFSSIFFKVFSQTFLEIFKSNFL